MKGIRIFGMFLVFLAGLLVMINSVAADYTFQDVEVNGVESSGTVYVERGETVDIRVELTSDVDAAENTRVKAWIGGYEYDDVEDRTDIKNFADLVKIYTIKCEKEKIFDFIKTHFIVSKLTKEDIIEIHHIIPLIIRQNVEFSNFKNSYIMKGIILILGRGYITPQIFGSAC